jgi:hypothetical protein
MITSIGKLLIDSKTPKQYREHGVLDKSGIDKLFTKMAKEMSPDAYVDALKNMTRAANKIAGTYGDMASARLRDLVLPESLQSYREEMREYIYGIIQNPRLSSQEKSKMIVDYVREKTPEIDKKITEVMAQEGNAFGVMVSSGIRGSKQQLRQMVFGDLLTMDSNGKAIGYPTLNAYAEGITPLEYFTASHGGRSGYIAVQKATADSGYLSKRVRQVAHRQVVMANDCGKARPYVVEADDEDNIGTLLFEDTKGIDGTVYPKDTIITEEILENLKGDIAIRNPLTCGQRDGICAKCEGIRESNKLGFKGEAVGLNAVNSFLEGVTQSALCLHPDTEIRMADWSVKKIKDIQPGDIVIAVDRQGNTFSTPVIALHDNGLQELYLYTIDDPAGKLSVCCTAEHKFLMYHMPSATYSINKIGEQSRSYLLSHYVENVLRNSAYYIEEYVGRLHTFDIEINTEDHLFLLANGMITSNSSKHGGGEAVQTARIKKGFAAIEQFIDMPEEFVGGAVISDYDGIVGKPTPAPQGGYFLPIGNDKVHILADQTIKVNPGQEVSKGDILTDGMVNISKVTKYKGIGAGRKAFSDHFINTLADNGIFNLRRNIETMARGYISRVKITDPDGVAGKIIGDITDYDDIEAVYKPREGFQELPIEKSKGKYLEAPASYFSIGTKVTPDVIKELKRNRIKTVKVHNDPAPFEPIVVPAKQFTAKDEDFLVGLAGENLMRSIQEHTTRGSETEKDSTSYYPRTTFMSYLGEKQDLIKD